MINPSQIKPHMPVVGSNNQQFAMVDHIDGNSLKLTKDASGQHHYIPLDWVTSVDDKVHIRLSGDECMKQWKSMPS